MSSSPPAAQPDQPKGPEAPSLAKDPTPDSQAALSEKQPETKPTEKTEDSAVAPATNVQAPPTNVDSTRGPDTDPELEKVTETERTTAAGGAPIDRQLMLRRKKALHVDTRLARFFTWLLLLGFVVVPGTFSKDSGTLRNLPLLPVAYVCCVLNALGYFVLWRRRRSDSIWLYTNLFFAGLVNAFSGFITTIVNVYGVQDGHFSTASRATLAITCTYTALYALLSVFYYRKHLQGTNRRSRVSSVAV
ncbi:hypothetical protein BC827DRAFT_1374566 [Russula dissimulans]|nr:hypothetical protein BC827DRAFT_1374566 [Russula dissimulans]